MTCFYCIHFRATYPGHPAYCTKRKPGFPGVGQACRAFEYEPGSDEGELTSTDYATLGKGEEVGA